MGDQHWKQRQYGTHSRKKKNSKGRCAWLCMFQSLCLKQHFISEGFKLYSAGLYCVSGGRCQSCACLAVLCFRWPMPALRQSYCMYFVSGGRCQPCASLTVQCPCKHWRWPWCGGRHQAGLTPKHCRSEGQWGWCECFFFFHLTDVCSSCFSRL